MNNFGILLMVLIWREASACNTERLPVGPRLLKAKACFGAVMRECHKELVEIVRLLKPAKAMVVITEYCRTVNACKEAVEKLTTDNMCQCIMGRIRNTSATIYTQLDVPLEFADRFNDLKTCAETKKILETPWTVLEDVYNVFYRTAKNFGWR